MSTLHTNQDDPLIAALPPETDYITYLTLLEYQLTSENLPTLTGLLTADDGTLAKEIGWDLLKLVLPLSEQAPEEARSCLEVVARRGNPREVVVRVAEELENLARSGNSGNSDQDQEFDDEEGEDGLPTFAGEAERIHLGDMTLGGMSQPSALEPAETDDEVKEVVSGSTERAFSSVKFQMLLSMLGLLHPRIQTAYPSRFLATSLPAALAAYRRLPVDSPTTYAFLAFLGKLSGKQRPSLPPRTSTATVSHLPDPTDSVTVTASSAPLPDPEASTESTTTITTSNEETAIMQRLLQAVLLELFDEFTQALATVEPPYMSYTARLREMNEPGKTVPGRQAEHEKWLTRDDLRERDAIVTRFLHTSKDLGIDIDAVFAQSWCAAKDAKDGSEEPDDAGSPSDYPTSPTQIAFPENGVLLLYVARHFSFRAATPTTPTKKLVALDIFPDLVHTCQAFDDPAKHPALRTNPSSALLDGILALLYNSSYHGNLGQSSSLTPHFINTMLSLTEICAENPDPYIRDSAHTVAANIFHQCPEPKLKVSLLKTLLRSSTVPNLRAVAVNWLKDECGQKTPTALPLDILNTDPHFADVLFSVPALSSDTTSPLWAQIPLYVSLLNLLSILALQGPGLHDRVRSQGEGAIDTISALRDSMQGSDAELEDQGLQLIDLWTLDDALHRARDAFAKQAPF